MDNKNPVWMFLTRQGRINLRALRSLYHFLLKAQKQNGKVSEDDVANGLAIGARLSSLEAAAHVSFVLDSTLSPILTQSGRLIMDRKGSILMKLKPDAFDSETIFIEVFNSIISMHI